MKKRILEFLENKGFDDTVVENTVLNISQELCVSRTIVASQINSLVSDGLVVKVIGEKTYFVLKEYVEERIKKKINQTVYKANEFYKLFYQGPQDFQKLIGNKESLAPIVDKLKAAVSYPPSGLPVLLHGPTGSGKSYLIKLLYEYAINYAGMSNEGKFVHVNCSEYANNPELLTAILFGYKKGAFTGADQDNVGLVKSADKGILFLDEVHCLKPECQEKLFLFMDSGEYRMLGDNESTYHSDVFLAFATTEDPHKVLLKTLYRRIPIRIEVPSLEERTQKEKEALIISCFKEEEKRIGKQIKISTRAYNLMLNAKYSGNIGELKNHIQVICMTSLYRQVHSPFLEVHSLALPDALFESAEKIKGRQVFIENKMMSLDELQVENNKNDDSLLEDMRHMYYQLKNNHMDIPEFFAKCNELLNVRYAKYLFEEYKLMTEKKRFLINHIKDNVESLSATHGITLNATDTNKLIFFIANYVDNTLNIEVDQEMIHFLKIKCQEQYVFAKEIFESVVYAKDASAEMIICILAMLIKESDCMKKQESCIGIVIAHGYATASSISSAVNQLLGKYVFDGIDMPLDVSTAVIVEKIKYYLSKRNNVQEVILLVDMGSLEEIYKGLEDTIDANFIIVNNVNTKLALNIGEGMIQKESLEKMCERIESSESTKYQVVMKQVKDRVILCSCATGMGTAEKLKTIIETALPQKWNIKVLTYDYSSLIKEKEEASLLKNNNVICIVGTLNPHINDIAFVPIEDMILNQSLVTVLERYVEDNQEIDQFKKEILKNFSLTNIIENLTLLNPKQLLEKVSSAVDHLQLELNMSFTDNICFGLYVHISCMIERLVTKDYDDEYSLSIDECTKEDVEFIMHTKNSFRELEDYYHVSIPIEEIMYIKIYINHFKMNK